MKVIIAGAGIGGLATALSLHARGIDCAIYEQAPEVRELGVGINILPHAVKRLAKLGLLDELDANAIRTEELLYTNRFGQTVWHETRGKAAGYDVPQFSVHRGRLQTILLNAVLKRLGPVIHVGHRLIGFGQGDSSILARFSRGGGGVSVEGDVLIGADGIHSLTRSILFPDEGPARWSGITMLRGAIEWPEFLTGRSMIISGGIDEKLVIYPIGAGSGEDRVLTSWVLNIMVGAAGAPAPRKMDWTRPGAREELLARSDRFSNPYLDIRGMLEATPRFWESPMCDRDPLPYWSLGRVTLLGDAAHPMYPMGSNGAGQAIIDADTLADKLAGSTDIQGALQAYERERLPVTAEVVRRNRLGGPEIVIDKVQELSPDGFSDIESVLPLAERRRMVEEYASSAGFSKERVNG